MRPFEELTKDCPAWLLARACAGPIRAAHTAAIARGSKTPVIVLASHLGDAGPRLLAAACGPAVVPCGPIALMADEDGAVHLLLVAGFSARETLAMLDELGELDVGDVGVLVVLDGEAHAVVLRADKSGETIHKVEITVGPDKTPDETARAVGDELLALRNRRADPPAGA